MTHPSYNSGYNNKYPNQYRQQTYYQGYTNNGGYTQQPSMNTIHGNNGYNQGNIMYSNNNSNNNDSNINTQNNDEKDYEIITLKKEEELRILVNENDHIRIWLKSGVAEIFGTELKVATSKGQSSKHSSRHRRGKDTNNIDLYELKNSYLFRNCSIPIFTWHGCTLVLKGKYTTKYKDREVYIILALIYFYIVYIIYYIGYIYIDSHVYVY